MKELGGKPFLTDCNTLYPAAAKMRWSTLYCAWENGFTPLTVGCPVLIGDGLKGTDDIAVPVVGGEYLKEAKIGRAIMDADVFISLTHFKGHEMTASAAPSRTSAWAAAPARARRTSTTTGKPQIDEEMCRGCMRCQRECAQRRAEVQRRNAQDARRPGKLRGAAAAAWARATLTPSSLRPPPPSRSLTAAWRSTQSGSGRTPELPYLAYRGRVAQLRLPRRERRAHPPQHRHVRVV